MKSSYWGYWLILLGILIVGVMILVQNVTTTNTQDYYLIKETAQSAMTDAVDYAYYRKYGEIRINKEKFVENFLLRFSETVNINTTYTVNFYDLYEAPPKVSIEVKSKSNSVNVAGDSNSFDIVNRVDAILEMPREEQ